MRILLISLLGLAGIWTIDATPVQIYKRIVQGKKCNDNEAKYQVLLKINGYRCGGTLLRGGWVLTAAHCNGTDLKVYVGVRKFSQAKTNKPYPGSVHINPWYDRSKEKNDIMLIKLNKAVPADATHADLPTCSTNPSDQLKEPPGNTDFLLAGWGSLTAEKPYLYPDDLHCVKIKKTPREKYAVPLELSEEHFLAGTITKGAAPADSGGGLVHTNGNRNEVVGVVQSQLSFTTVCKHINWINEVISKN